jgi:hypothetical protein
MVTLRFYAREDALASIPGSRANIGQAANYIGRKYEKPDAKTGKPAKYPATPEPHEVTFSLDKEDDRARFNRYVKIAKRGDIWPADEATAKACDVDLPEVEFHKDDGEWRRAAPLLPLAPGNASAPSGDVETSAPAIGEPGSGTPPPDYSAHVVDEFAPPGFDMAPPFNPPVHSSVGTAPVFEAPDASSKPSKKRF